MIYTIYTSYSICNIDIEHIYSNPLHISVSTYIWKKPDLTLGYMKNDPEV